ncbi:MAG: DUF5071 domain-containing protein [Desulfobacteraceae bacterium]|nr:DUF5071 domain-containing protein [Desulfobacteraceae bacterium]
MEPQLPYINHKDDMISAKTLVRLGYPAVSRRLGHMMEWTADSNWPVASVLMSFLSSLGDPVVPEIQKVLRGDDLTSKYSCISNIITFMPKDAAVYFRKDLERLANRPTKEEIEEELHEVAQSALAELDWREMEGV